MTLHSTLPFFRRHGGAAVVLARFVPMVRTFAPLAAGIGRSGYRSFTRWNVAEPATTRPTAYRPEDQPRKNRRHDNR